jgi:hypothetical protein
MHRFGMDDAATAELLLTLTERRQLPDFTVAYFADNDFRSHEVGPHAALPVIERVDAALGAVFEAAGGLDAFLRDSCVIVTSDHGHCDIAPDAARAVVRLDQVLGDFPQASLGTPWRDPAEIMICPNMRAAQLYLRYPTPETIARVARTCLLDPRIDLVMWKRSLTAQGEPGFAVAGPRGHLEFWRAEQDGPGASGRDAFGTRWTWRGDPEVLAFDVDREAIGFTDFPNAFERIAGALDAPNSGEMWLTVEPGCEFEVPGGSAHVGGGSHGALHALDTLSPVLMAGLPRGLPREMRSVDLAPLCMEALGIPMRYKPGDPRVIAPGPRRRIQASRNPAYEKSR